MTKIIEKKIIVAILIAMFSTLAFGCGNDKKDSKEKKSTPTFIETSIETTVENIETDSTTEVVETTEETTTEEAIQPSLLDITTEFPLETTAPETTKKQPATTKPQTTVKQDPTINIQTTQGKIEWQTDRDGETFTTHIIETHPVDPDWQEETTTVDYSGYEQATDENIPDVFEEIGEPVYRQQMIDEIQYKTRYVRNWINNSLISPEVDSYNKFLLDAIIRYMETHDASIFDFIQVDDMNGDDWREVLASQLYYPDLNKTFNWNDYTQFSTIYKNLLWDTVYNDDFSNITNIQFLPVPEKYEDRVFQDYDGYLINYNLKISFSSGGANYVAWFAGCSSLLDIDRID